jgi:hypothetical protein
MHSLTGKCLCGQALYSCDAEPIASFICNCKDCQRQTGSAFFVGLAVPDGTIETEGKLATYTQPGGATGRLVHRRFCPECGSPLLLQIEESGRTYIMAGTLDDTSVVKPVRAIFCASKQSWVPLPSDVPQFDGSPS